MLKVYHIHDYVSIDGADWREVGGYGDKAINGDPETEIRLDNASFDEAREYLSQNYLSGVWNDTAFLRNQPTIRVSYNDAWDSVEYRNFDTISYKREFEEWTKVSLKWIIENLPAEQTIQYLKERGIATCPMNF